MSNQLIDNTYLMNKINLRLNHLPDKKNIKVLDLYSGDGRIWDGVRKRYKGNIEVLRIDRAKGKRGLYLIGDNAKYLKTINLPSFDVIDADAYGIPYSSLKIILDRYKEKPFSCRVFVTYIQTMFRQLPYGMLQELGYSRQMIMKVPTLFSRNGFDKFCHWLSLYGIRDIIYRSKSHYNYIYFELHAP